MEMPKIFEGTSIKRLIQGAVIGAIATIVVGFAWGGWVLGSTAQTQVSDAEQASIVRVLAPICADRFQHAADVNANLKALNAAEAWTRDEMIEKAGWSTFPGSQPDRKVAEACLGMLKGVKQ
jgi:alpha/beta superfamily hydrolase